MSNRQDDALPELPLPDIWVREDFGLGDSTVHVGYSAELTREYAQSAIASLQARLDAAEADAARYRYLKQASVGGWMADLLFDDVAIDDAISRSDE